MLPRPRLGRAGEGQPQLSRRGGAVRALIGSHENTSLSQTPFALSLSKGRSFFSTSKRRAVLRQAQHERGQRSEEHTSEFQSLMRISYAVFCLKKKNN